MRENQVEKHLVKRVKELKGLCIKINSTSMNGLPDRMVLLPGGKIVFFELKSTGCTPRPLQMVAMKKLIDLGFGVFIADNKEKVDAVLAVMIDEI